MSYEDSKYLGGDVAHTHLVKGLDFALLQKARGGALGGSGLLERWLERGPCLCAAGRRAWGLQRLSLQFSW